jgi:hypothetical protein
LIFEVGFEFFGVFRLGLAENEESHQIWFGWKLWVTVGSAVADECIAREVREKKKKKKKKKKNQGRACVFCSHFSLCIFF